MTSTNFYTFKEWQQFWTDRGNRLVFSLSYGVLMVPLLSVRDATFKQTLQCLTAEPPMNRPRLHAPFHLVLAFVFSVVIVFDFFPKRINSEPLY